MLGFLALAPAALLSVGLIAPAADLRARVESAPRDVEAFIVRRAMCNHFLGEEPYNKERAADLDRAIRELRCARLERDERGLRRTFRKHPAVLMLLDETTDILAW